MEKTTRPKNNARPVEDTGKQLITRNEYIDNVISALRFAATLRPDTNPAMVEFVNSIADGSEDYLCETLPLEFKKEVEE